MSAQPIGPAAPVSRAPVGDRRRFAARDPRRGEADRPGAVLRSCADPGVVRPRTARTAHLRPCRAPRSRVGTRHTTCAIPTCVLRPTSLPPRCLLASVPCHEPKRKVCGGREPVAELVLVHGTPSPGCRFAPRLAAPQDAIATLSALSPKFPGSTGQKGQEKHLFFVPRARKRPDSRSF